MTDPDTNSNTSTGLLRSIRFARRGGKVFGLVLILGGLLFFLRGAGESSFGSFRAIYSIFYGGLLCLPFARFPAGSWKISFIAVCLFSAAHVFVLVVAVMYQYIELAEMGERLGVPGLEGSLVFLSLLQPPTLLFERHPDFLD